MEEFDKLKAELDDGTATYKLAVTSHGLKEIFRGGGLAAVNFQPFRRAEICMFEFGAGAGFRKSR